MNVSNRSRNVLRRYVATLLVSRWIVLFVTFVIIAALASGLQFLKFSNDYRVFLISGIRSYRCWKKSITSTRTMIRSFLSSRPRKETYFRKTRSRASNGLPGKLGKYLI